MIQINFRRNTSIQMDLSKSNSFLIEESINFIARTEKERKYDKWNAWVLCVFFLFYHGNWREAGLQLLYHLSFSCFVNKVLTSWYYAVTKNFFIDDGEVRDPPLVCLFPVQNIIKNLKFNEIDIYMFKVKKESTRTRSEICSKLTTKTPKLR